MSDTDVTGRSEGMDEDPTEAVETPADSMTAVDDDAVSDPEAGPVGAEEEFSDDEEGSEDDEDGDEADDETASESSARRPRRVPSLKRLEEEGEVAADYLEELLDITDLDGDIDIDVENGRASVAVVAEEENNRDLNRLVGSRGEVLEALQELTRLAVQARTGERSRLMLDVAGFRAARRRALEVVAAKACEEVVTGGTPVRLDPMSAFERKVVHDVVAGAGLRSESEGEEPSRRVVVFPVSQ
ncbi:MAG: spoIIIJ-associated protein [Actinomycetota bacterium]|nr:spoIIIJ-associated protein [Actinomycetota bacterium]